MRAIPIDQPNGMAELTGGSTGSWLSLAQVMATRGMTMPEGTNVARIQAHEPLSWCMAPDAVDADPSIPPIILPAGAMLDLYDSEQMRHMRILDDLFHISIQYYRA